MDQKLAADQAFLTYDKHLARALRHLNVLLEHFAALYKIEPKTLTMKCSEIKLNELKYFKKV